MNILVTIKTEAERALSDLDAAIKEFGKLKKATDKNSQVVKCNQLLSRCKNQVDSYKLELRGPQIPEDQKPALREELSQLQTTMKKLIAELDYCKMEHKKGQLVGANPQQQEDQAIQDVETLETAQLVGDRIQDKTAASLGRSKQQAVEAREIAVQIEATLAEHEEKLEGIGKELDDMQFNIKRSKKLVSRMARQAANDRCIQIICVLITSALIILIVIYAIHFGEDGTPQVYIGQQ